MELATAVPMWNGALCRRLFEENEWASAFKYDNTPEPLFVFTLTCRLSEKLHRLCAPSIAANVAVGETATGAGGLPALSGELISVPLGPPRPRRHHIEWVRMNIEFWWKAR